MSMAWPSYRIAVRREKSHILVPAECPRRRPASVAASRSPIRRWVACSSPPNSPPRTPGSRRPPPTHGSLDEPWAALGRLIMGIGGGVLVALFFCPWHGVSSWQLLETLSGADFVRQLFYLTGGIVLLAAAVLPLPFVFRAAV